MGKLTMTVEGDKVTTNIENMSGEELMFCYFSLKTDIEEKTGMPFFMVEAMFIKHLQEEGLIGGDKDD